MEFCHESNSPDDFHALRKMVKQLWYAIRITSCFWPEKGSDLIQALALMGEMAGKERDLTLLAETLSQGPSNRPAEKLISMIREELPALRKAALGAASRFYESKPKVFVEVLNL